MVLFVFLLGVVASLAQAVGSVAPRLRPLADLSRRAFRSGVTPEYEWLRDASIQCARVAKQTHVENTARAMELCDQAPSCEAFKFVTGERSVELCRGFDIEQIVTRSPGTVVGIKPSTLAVESMAVLTNQHAICPSSRLLAEIQNVTSIDEAFRKCKATPACSHYSFDLSGSRSTPADEQRLILCSGDAVAVPKEGAVTVVDAL